MFPRRILHGGGGEELGIGLLKQDAKDFAEAECDDREIVAAKTERWQSDEPSGAGCDEPNRKRPARRKRD